MFWFRLRKEEIIHRTHGYFSIIFVQLYQVLRKCVLKLIDTHTHIHTHAYTHTQTHTTHTHTHTHTEEDMYTWMFGLITLFHLYGIKPKARVHRHIYKHNWYTYVQYTITYSHTALGNAQGFENPPCWDSSNHVVYGTESTFLTGEASTVPHTVGITRSNTITRKKVNTCTQLGTVLT